MPAPVRLVIVLSSLRTGGAERTMVRLLAGLDRERVSPALVVLERTGGLVDDVPADVEVVDLATPRLRSAVRGLTRAVRGLAPDVVLSTATHLNIALGLRRRRLGSRGRRPALVLRVPSLPSLDLPAQPHPWLSARGARRAYPRAARVVVTGARMAEEVRALGVAADRVALVANPIDVDALRSVAPVRAPGPGRRIVAVGRLETVKGFDRLPALLAALDGDDRVTIVGEGSARAAIVAAARASGVTDRVDLVGHDPAPWARMAGADVLVVPARAEGLPNAALEALACGTPVVATPDAGGVVDLAAAAAPGAVRVVGPGAPMVAALAAVTADPGRATTPRPSLLPAAHGAAEAIAAWTALLEAVAPAASGRADGPRE